MKKKDESQQAIAASKRILNGTIKYPNDILNGLILVLLNAKRKKLKSFEDLCSIYKTKDISELNNIFSEHLIRFDNPSVFLLKRITREIKGIEQKIPISSESLITKKVLTETSKEVLSELKEQFPDMDFNKAAIALNMMVEKITQQGNL